MDHRRPGLIAVVLACVVNVSEGRADAVVAALVAAGGAWLLDVHEDADHNRSVLTLAGAGVEGAVRSVARQAVERIDLRHHRGVHPRFGAIDVVPFVPLEDDGAPRPVGSDLAEALAARERFARWAGDALGLPCFLYGPERTLPEVRRHAFTGLAPDHGPPRPHPSAGACAVGARHALVAYNLWLSTGDVAVARAVASAARGPFLRTLGLAVTGGTQVSCNLVDPVALGPAEVYDLVSGLARRHRTAVARAELVGLVPAAVVRATPRDRLGELDLDEDRTLEARLTRVTPE